MKSGNQAVTLSICEIFDVEATYFFWAHKYKSKYYNSKNDKNEKPQILKICSWQGIVAQTFN